MVYQNESIFIKDVLPQVLGFDIDFQYHKPDEAEINF